MTDTPAEQDPGGLGRQAASGVFWATAQKWIVRVSGLATIAILTRVLTPEDFGVVAAASTIIPLVYLLSDMGFSTYIVQSSDPNQRVLSTAFWFGVAAGAGLCLGLVAVAPLLGELFDLPAVVPVLRGMVPAIWFVAVAAVPTAILRRRMAFRSLALQSGVAAIAGQVVAVVLMLSGAGVWALVAQLVVGQATTTVLVCWIARWLPSWQFARQEFVAMVRFGTQVVAVELVAIARSWAETAIIASSLGATGLGYLNIAQRLVQVTQDLSTAALMSVSTVVFARVRDSAERLRSAYLRALGLSYVVVSPLLTFLVVGAPLVVPLLFGDRWGQSVPVAQALAVAGILTLGAMLDHGLFYGTGRPGKWLMYAVVVDAATVATDAFAVRYGLTGVAIGFVGVAMAATFVRWRLVGRLIGVRAVTVARPFGVMVVLTTLSAMVGLVTMRIAEGLPVLVTLGLTGTAMLCVYIAVLKALMPKLFAEVVRLVPSNRSAAMAPSRWG